MARAALSSLAALTTLGVALLVLSVGGLVMIAALAGGAMAGQTSPGGLTTSFVAGDRGNTNKLLLVPISGAILGDSSGDGGLFAPSGTYGYEIQDALDKAAERRDIDGIILEMDTPGGTIFGSRAISEGVRRYQEATGKPVIAYVRSISASGGMYAMAGADRIVADHGTLIGSIGVIFGPFSFYDGVVATDGGLLGGGVETKGGITVEYITAGRSKDIGNPYRKMTDEERKVLQQGVDNAYTEFVTTVATGRDLEPDVITGDLGALIYDERTAQEKGLIDEIGDRDAAYGAAAEAAKLSNGDYQVIRLQLGGGGLFGGLAGRLNGGDDRSRAGGTCVRGPLLLAMATAPPAC
jgi:protease-4